MTSFHNMCCAKHDNDSVIGKCFWGFCNFTLQRPKFHGVRGYGIFRLFHFVRSFLRPLKVVGYFEVCRHQLWTSHRNETFTRILRIMTFVMETRYRRYKILYNYIFSNRININIKSVPYREGKFVIHALIKRTNSNNAPIMSNNYQTGIVNSRYSLLIYKKTHCFTVLQ